MARKAGELKKRCWLAKQRLKMGYWESVREDRQRSEADGASVQTAASIHAHVRLMRDAEVAAGLSPQDEKMYLKVCEILDSNEVTINPIGQLIERDVYDRLDGASRQRYVLELSEKFRELKDRYYRERTTGA